MPEYNFVAVRLRFEGVFWATIASDSVRRLNQTPSGSSCSCVCLLESAFDARHQSQASLERGVAGLQRPRGLARWEILPLSLYRPSQIPLVPGARLQEKLGHGEGFYQLFQWHRALRTKRADFPQEGLPAGQGMTQEGALPVGPNWVTQCQNQQQTSHPLLPPDSWLSAARRSRSSCSRRERSAMARRDAAALCSPKAFRLSCL